MDLSMECDEGADSLLFCEEDNSSFLDDGDVGCDGVGGGCFDSVIEFEGRLRDVRGFVVGGEILLWGLLPVQSEECLEVMIDKEKDYGVGVDYVVRLKSGDLDLSERSCAVDWILKAHAHFGFGPLCAYLAISFMDRFMSAYELPKGQGWTAQLLAVACLSIAAKMEETEIPFTMSLQAYGSKFIFEAKTIQRMELLILSTLKWRMQAVTPFSFIDSFLHMINVNKDPSRTLLLKAIKLISSTNKGIELLEFRPSEVAGALALFLTDGDKSFHSISHYLDKEKVMKCARTMQEIGLINGEVAKAMCSDLTTSDIPHSPTAVLDRLPSVITRSYETMAGTSSSVESNKRRRLNNDSPEIHG